MPRSIARSLEKPKIDLIFTVPYIDQDFHFESLAGILSLLRFQGEAVDGFALEAFVGVEVLAGRLPKRKEPLFSGGGFC